MKKILFLLLVIGLGLTTTAHPATATNHENTEQEEQCISLQRIDQTPVIDNKTILVDLRGGGYKRIDIRNRCPGLKFEGRYTYSTSISKLCKQDSLTVLSSDGSPIGTCLIDKIVTIDEAEAKALLSKR